MLDTERKRIIEALKTHTEKPGRGDSLCNENRAMKSCAQHNFSRTETAMSFSTHTAMLTDIAGKERKKDNSRKDPKKEGPGRKN